MIPQFSPEVAIQNGLDKIFLLLSQYWWYYQELTFYGEKKIEVYFLKLISMKTNLFTSWGNTQKK